MSQADTPTPPQPASSSSRSAPCSLRCFECETGNYETKLMEYTTTDSSGKEMKIRDVPHEVCDTCGAVCFSAEASRIIETAREKAGVVYRKSLANAEVRRDD